ncbi:MAG: 50S ribosomal protein L21 [Pseudomonadota bacterium]
MFAVLKTGGKQYRVQAGDVLRVEKLAATAGEKVQFNDILMVGATVGTPLVEGAAVQADVLDQIKGEKTISFVKRRRKHSSKRTRGHRQQLTVLRVTDILESGADATGVKEAVGTAGQPLPEAPASAAPAADPTPAPAEQPAEAPAAAPAPEATGTKPGNLLEAAREGNGDALKKLAGLGPKAADALNAAGVFHFDQLASWSSDEIAYMEGETGLKGKIAAWAEEAKTMGGDAETAEADPASDAETGKE